MATISYVDIKKLHFLSAYMEDWIPTVAEFSFSKYGRQTTIPKLLAVIT
jgi:hypothetical protein